MGGVGGPRLGGSKERAGRVREVRAPRDMCPLSPLSLGLCVLKSWLPADRQWGHQGEGPIALGVKGIGWGSGVHFAGPMALCEGPGPGMGVLLQQVKVPWNWVGIQWYHM